PARTSPRSAPCRASPRPRAASPARPAGPRGGAAGCRPASGRTSGRTRCRRARRPRRGARRRRAGSGGSRAAPWRGQPSARGPPNTVHTALRYAADVLVAVAALAALPASFLTIRGLLHTPAARHVVAAPRADRWHTRSTPLLGGRGVIAGILAAAGIGLATGEIHGTGTLAGIVGGCAILFLAGLFDDVFQLPPTMPASLP